MLTATAAPAVFANEQPVATIDQAQARFEPDGLLPVEWRRVDLHRRWDLDFPGRDGRATYRIELPPHAGQEPMALLFSRVGNQAQVLLDGHLLQRWGRLGDPAVDAGKTARMLALPAALLHLDRPTLLTVEVTVQQQRWGGLSVLRYGPQDAIDAMVEAQHRWQHSLFLLIGCTLTGMGIAAAALWWRQREALYGWFSAAALLGSVRDVDRIWSDLPVPWPAWGGIEAACFAVHLCLIAMFTLAAVGSAVPRVRRAIGIVAAVVCVLAGLGFNLGVPMLWTVALASLIPLGTVSLGLVARAAWRERSPSAYALLGAGAVAVAAGVADFSLIRLGASSGFRLQLTPPAMFAYIVVMAGLVVARYNRSVADHRRLNAELTSRVAAREAQLQVAFDALAEQRHLQAVAGERQRIMRDIHDGVGSQLVALQHLAAREDTEAPVLQQHIAEALDELRLAVDSLQPSHCDLLAVLATLRWRLQPRLEAAGVKVLWDIGPAALPSLEPQAALHAQRLLAETFTNVLRHARASAVRVRSYELPDPPSVGLEISDDGVGFAVDADDPLPAGERRGLGLPNMQARAAAIGATLRVSSPAGGGVCVALEWPAGSSPEA